VWNNNKCLKPPRPVGESGHLIDFNPGFSSSTGAKSAITLICLP
jgi:hypothetical protein